MHSFLTMPKNNVRNMLISMLLLMSFSIFQYFPGVAILRELWIVTLFLFLVMPYLFWKASTGWRFLSYEVYLLLMMGMMPLHSGVAAWLEFEQPIFYGVLAQRNMFLGIGALALIYAVRRQIISVRDVEKSLLWLSWVLLFLYLVIEVTFEPTQFADYHGGFVSGENIGEASFRFNTLLIVFAFYYYVFQGFRRKSLKHYIYATLFITYLVVDVGGRSLILSVVCAFVFFIWRWGSIGRLIVFLPRFGMAALVLLAILFSTKEDYVNHLVEKFGDAFTVVATGERTKDASANARIFETAIALPYIEKNWLIGNGDISNRWHDGYEGVLGGYFYPSDIGVIGVIYMYGAVGTLFFLIQFIFAVRFSRKAAKVNATGPLLDAIKGFLLYFAIHSLVTGGFAHSSEVNFVFIALIWCITLEASKIFNDISVDITGNNH